MENQIKVIDIANHFKAKPSTRVIGSHQESNPDRNRMTLDELKKYDDENHRLILKESNHYKCNTLNDAGVFKMHCYLKALTKLGVTDWTQIVRATPWVAGQHPEYFNKLLEKECAAKNVVVDDRGPETSNNPEEDGWKSGAYIYLRGDIVYFISNPFSTRKKSGMAYIVGEVDFWIVTNVRI